VKALPSRRALGLVAAGLLLLAASPRTTTGPQYDGAGALLRPEGHREWVFVGASLGLSYREGAADSGPGEFHHVYIRPESYDAFLRTGQFPDRTMLVLELHEAAQKVAPGRHGLFEGKQVALEVAVKDARLPDGWGYFGFGDGSAARATAFPRTACFACHREHAAVDNVFVQFYPVLRDARH
jgi:cytochrome P460